MIAPRFASFLCLVINIYIWTLAGSSLRFLCDRFCGGRMSRHCTAKRARLGNFPSSGLDRRLPRSASSVCHPSLQIARTTGRPQLLSSTLLAHSFLDAILESRPLSASCLARCKCNRSLPIQASRSTFIFPGGTAHGGGAFAFPHLLERERPVPLRHSNISTQAINQPYFLTGWISSDGRAAL